MAAEDVEIISTPPRKNKRGGDDSPGVQTVGSDTTNGMSINHTFSSSNSRSAAIAGMSKPVAAAVGLALLGTGGAAAMGWMRIPGLNEQIEDLEEQIDRLNLEVDRLSVENDRYEHLNDELNVTVEDLKIVNEEMKIQVGLLEGEVSRLHDEVDAFEVQNDRYERINSDLNTTVGDLQGINSALFNTTFELETSLLHLNASLFELDAINDGLEGENDRLAELNDQLQSIGSFLNVTATGIERTFESIVSFLAEQIEANRRLVLQDLQLGYQDQVTHWGCEYRNYFRGATFTEDYNAPIGTSILQVLSYVDDRVMARLCVKSSDFQAYLSRTYGLDVLSTNHLFQGVTVYLTGLMKYYFPITEEDAEKGLTPEDWASAGYDCSGVPQYQLFLDRL